MNPGPTARPLARWIPYLGLGVSLAVTGVAASYMRGVVKRQADHELADQDRFVAAMKRVDDEFQGQIQGYDARLREAALRQGGVLPKNSLAAPPDSELAENVRFTTLTALAESGEDAAMAGAIRTVFSWPRKSGSAGRGVPALGPHIGGADQQFLLYIPLYAAKSPHDDADAPVHPAAIVYTTLSVTTIAATALDSASLGTLHIRLYRGLDTAAAGLIYDSGHRGIAANPRSQLRSSTALDVLGTPWTLRIDALPAFGATADIDPGPTVLVTGGLLALMIFGSTLARARTQRHADDTQARYYDLFNGTPIPMWLYDTETLRIVAVNDAAVTRYGYSRSEFHALTIDDLQPTDAVPIPRTELDQPLASHHEDGLWRHRIKDGTIIDVEIVAHPMRFKGRPSEMVVAHDISERRCAEAAMRESEERLRQMANHINEAFFVVELPAWQPVYVSSTWAEIWGRPMSEASNPDVWLDAIHPDDRPSGVEAQEMNRQGEPAVTVFRVVRPDGTLRRVRGRTFPVRDERGAVYRVVGVSEDITELRLAESRFAQAQKMEAIGRLAGGVAHDFNNLLTVILGEADELQRELAPDTPAAASATEIRNAGQRAATLTRQLLAFSRRQLIAPVVFDLRSAVNGLGNMLRRLIGEDIDLVMRLAADTWNPIADPGQIEQVLANLVVNARDAMTAGGTLTIETGNVTLDNEYAREIIDVQPGDYVVMTVSDTGTGMTADVRARLFEPFFTTKEQGKGTGLGLATCYGIVKQTGGHMSVYSEPGLGTTAKVYLPRGVAAPDGDLTAEPPVLPRGGETILLVEDEVAVRRIAARLLQGQGYTLLEARNGAEAADLIASHRGNIDLLLTDVVLPGIGGREIAEQARAKRPGIKVLFTSGYTDDVILQHRLLEQHVALLTKPFSRESIARKVREVLDTPAVLAMPA